jgi:hypothetical protein
MLAGHSPYDLIGPGKPLVWKWPFVYPLPTAMIVAPLALLPVVIARAMFVGISVGLLAYARPGLLLVPLLVSQPFVNALWNAQRSPLLTAAMVLPGLAWVAIAKPQVGVAILAHKPSRQTFWIAVSGAILLVAAVTILQPDWMPKWIGALHAGPGYLPPILRPGGFVLALAALRWRTPEGRLLLALSVMPQTAMWYTALPLFLIPRTLVEGTILAGLSQIAFLLTAVIPVGSSWPAQMHVVGLLMLGALYVPCLIMVLRRPARLPARRTRTASGAVVPESG